MNPIVFAFFVAATVMLLGSAIIIFMLQRVVDSQREVIDIQQKHIGLYRMEYSSLQEDVYDLKDRLLGE